MYEDAESDDEALFESDEEDLEDQPCPTIVQDLDLGLQSPVLHLSIPSLTDSAHALGAAEVPPIFTQNIVVAVACEDGSAKVITLPLDPPSAATKRKRKLGARICDLHLATARDMLRGLAVTWTQSNPSTGDLSTSKQRQSRSTKRSTAERSQPSGTEILVAVATSNYGGALHFFSIPVSKTESSQYIAYETASAFHSTHTDALTSSLAFNSSPPSAARHSHLVISDVSGRTSVYEIFPEISSRPGSRSGSQQQPSPRLTLRLSSPYTDTKDPSVPSLSHIKRVLSAVWVLSGNSILVLLEDGTIGLYALSTSSPLNVRTPSSPFAFAASVFVGNDPERTSTLSDKPRRAQLAPMTPNTRRTKSESLFSGPVNGRSLPPRGGIAVRSTTNHNGVSDDCVVVYFNTRVYTIPSVREWWSRNAQGPSLHGTGMQELPGLELDNEVITSVDIMPERTTRSRADMVLGGNVMKGDVLVAGEYRTHVIAMARPKAAPRAEREGSSPSRADRRLLERGELGVDGLDRMLDGMEGVERRVGFMD
ncbi:DASH complex subunit ask1 [Sphaceloma murrayae]|uniref:DASH complex subunit ask1 n=1 Tax=Sphaceloma murrayae TaxID=2082308 RepID=A0A2K1R299_9PEZI|nr:DASH complex subunit ask1 [Sphaceloma murrayae]